MLLWQACDWMNALSIAQRDALFRSTFPRVACLGQRMFTAAKVVLLWMTWVHGGERLLQTDGGRVRCLFQHKCSPREQAFSILSTGHGVEHVNSAALIDQSGFSRWIQFWIIFSSMVNLPLLSKYIRLIEMFKGSTLGCGVCTSVRQVVCAAFMVWW